MTASTANGFPSDDRMWLRVARAATLVAAASLLTALISQFGFGLQPCEMCIWQRWPYVIGVGLAAPALQWRGAPRRALLTAAGLTFLVGVGLGVFHSGVEWHWWEGVTSCSSSQPTGLTPAELLDYLKKAPLVRCDDRNPFFLGLSMANWNVLVSLDVAACFLLSAALAGRERR